MIQVREYYLEVYYEEFIHHEQDIQNFNPKTINIYGNVVEIAFDKKFDFMLFLEYIDQINGEIL